jgi:hypothetical protein
LRTSRPYKFPFDQPVILGTFIAAIYLIVIKPMGAGFEMLPGDLGDARLNNYILEHFYRWVVGLDESFWSAAFYYPYELTIGFSENFLGSAPLYASLRVIGFTMPAAFQGWFILGYAANYFAAVYVLRKFGFNSWAVCAGAFFFTFGLPILAKENHVQLLYRFPIPLAFYFLWRFNEAPELRKALGLLFWTVWQFYLSIYMGVFLIMLIFAMTVILVVLAIRARPTVELIRSWRKSLAAIWSNSPRPEQIKIVVSTLLLGISFIALMWPYVYVSRHYGFERTWEDIAVYLPRPESYLLADQSMWWSFLGRLVPPLISPAEHQLFVGMSVLVLMIIGILFRFSSKNTGLAQVSLITVLFLVITTLYIDGFSFYRVVAGLPGINSIRAVGRLELALAWPIAVYMAWVIDLLLERFDRVAWARILIFSSVVVLMMESLFYTHRTFSKAEAEARLDQLEQQIPPGQVNEPILFVASNEVDVPWKTELDTMLLAQRLGWPTLNGYSGNEPPGYEPAKACRRLPRRIQTYMEVSGVTDEAIYFDIMNRVVLVGFSDCDPDWWVKIP